MAAIIGNFLANIYSDINFLYIFQKPMEWAVLFLDSLRTNIHYDTHITKGVDLSYPDHPQSLYSLCSTGEWRGGGAF